jgi:hypothetical protein
MFNKSWAPHLYGISQFVDQTIGLDRQREDKHDLSGRGRR